MDWVHAFSRDKVGTTGANFLKISPGARARGMGEAFVGVADDAHSAWWNPAALLSLKGMEVALAHELWLETIKQDFVYLVQPLYPDAIGMGISYFWMEPMDRIDGASGPSGEKFSAYDLVGTLSYARPWFGLSLGGSLKYIQQKIDRTSGSSVALDLGILKTYSHSQWGLGIRNIGPSFKFGNRSHPLPLTTMLGLSYYSDKVIIAGELDLPIDNAPSFGIGIEHKERFGAFHTSGRVGYRTNTVKDLGYLTGLSAGLGLGINRFNIDYSWKPWGDLGTTHHISLRIGFGMTEAEERQLTFLRRLERLKKAIKEAASDREREKRTEELRDWLGWIAILEFASIGQGIDPALGRELTRELETHLAATGLVKMIGRKYVDEAMEEERIDLVGFPGKKTLLSLGQTLGAGYFIMGTVLKTSELYEIDLRLAETRAGTVLVKWQYSGKKEELPLLMARISKEITGHPGLEEETGIQEGKDKSLPQRDKISVAVVRFKAENVSESEATICSDLLRTNLVNMQFFTLVDREYMGTILKEQKFQQTGCTTQECAVKIGKILNVEKVIVGKLARLKDKYYLFISFVDVERGLIEYSANRNFGSLDKMESIIKNLSRKMALEVVKD